MSAPNHIDVQRMFRSPSLHTREQARLLFERIVKICRTNRNEELFINFVDVTFISRSFADELVHLVTQAEMRKAVQYCCMRPEVSHMIEAVTRTQMTRTQFKKIPTHRLSDAKELLDYFS